MTKDEMIISALEHLSEAINRQGSEIIQLRTAVSAVLNGIPYVGGGHAGNIHQVNDRLLQLKMLNTRNEDQVQRLIKEEF
jgi:hypothetical protein